MTMTVSRSVLLGAAVASVSALALAGCASPTKALSAQPLSVGPVAAQQAAIAPAKPCEDGLPPVASIDPGNVSATDRSTWPESATLSKIRERGRLLVGTSGDVLLWGARSPETGRLAGYDIDLLREVAIKLGVDPEKTEYRVINYAERLPSLKTDASRPVDLVAHTMTINCDRWQGTGTAPNPINFSSEYYSSGQKVLVRYNPITKKPEQNSIASLNGKKVCVPKGSTNIDNLAAYPKVIPLLVDDLGECLVEFQEGNAAAITGDDTVLAGFAAQDPYAKVVGEAFSKEPYGLGINADDPGFTRIVNAILEDLRSEGTLQALYDRWMAKAVTGPAPAVPKAVYGRDISRLGRS